MSWSQMLCPYYPKCKPLIRNHIQNLFALVLKKLVVQVELILNVYSIQLQILIGMEFANSLLNFDMAILIRLLDNLCHQLANGLLQRNYSQFMCQSCLRFSRQRDSQMQLYKEVECVLGEPSSLTQVTCYELRLTHLQLECLDKEEYCTWIRILLKQQFKVYQQEFRQYSQFYIQQFWVIFICPVNFYMVYILINKMKLLIFNNNHLYLFVYFIYVQVQIKEAINAHITQNAIHTNFMIILNFHFFILINLLIIYNKIIVLEPKQLLQNQIYQFINIVTIQRQLPHHQSNLQHFRQPNYFFVALSWSWQFIKLY
ncbi:unnamed protein product [Paramecium octaurelia]|uniref:Transmembrane protein n=1 Tax=Paramecium octaurelia TaxID=43137 RepID=A0A8S1XBT8_PAROT|nr:unnamed protein product [Paramecium octaurelia]